MTAELASRFCHHCGAALAEGARFCTGCGGPQDGAGPSPFAHPASCQVCGGEGARLAANQVYCAWCRWLRPLGPGYAMPVDAFMWSLDAEAMAALRRIGPLNDAARSLSNRIGRPWLEAAVNGVRLGPDQLPEIFEQAILAARIVGLPYLPEIYVSGEQMWEAQTLGTDAQAFVVIGSVLTNLRDEDMLYVLGREMGHCAAGHAMWKTVMQLLGGRKQLRPVMGEGVLQFLNPLKLVEGAVDAPLIAWARHAEITADRAGALVVGDQDVCRRVASQWALRSFPLYGRLNPAALERQIAESDHQGAQVSEWMMSATPYLMRRLKFMQDFFASQEMAGWRAVIEHWTRGAPATEAPSPQDVARVRCVSCGEPLRFPKSAFEGKDVVKVRCANASCRQVMEVRPKAAAPAPEPEAPSLRLHCAACNQPMRIARDALAGRAEIQVRCPNLECRAVLTVRQEGAAPARPAPDQLSEE